MAESAMGVTSGETQIPVAHQSTDIDLRCLIVSYHNLVVNELTEQKNAQLLNCKAINQRDFVNFLLGENYMHQLGSRRRFTGVPEKDGNYIVCLTASHADALRVSSLN